MRPIKLVIQAFGAFAKRIEIPFSDLGASNIYLISGDTGSGKTTIFDAICYALFNSSSTSVRGNETLRSHFADDNVESFVEFDFLFNNKSYKIIRYPSYLKLKPRVGGYKLESSKAQLFLPDGKIITKVSEIDSYIVELLGIDSKQFSQIALLAQGEFLKLLNADTQTRGEIFRNIFKTSDYSLFQEKLKFAMLDIKKEYDFLENGILQLISQIDIQKEEFLKLRDDYINSSSLFDFEKFLLLFDEHNLLIKKQIDEYNVKISNKNKTLLDFQKRIQDCQTKTNFLNQLEVLEKEYLQHLILFDIAKQNFQKLANKEKELQDIILNLNKLDNDYKICLEISEIEKQIVDKNLEFKNIESKISQLEQNIVEFQKRHILNINFVLSNLDKDLKKAQENLILLQKDYDDKNLNYNSLSKKYFNSQAGILAQSLKVDEPCPVCGSLIHPKPAKVEENIVSLELLDKLKAENDELMAQLHKKTSDCSLLLLKIENLNNELLKFSKKYNFKTSEQQEYLFDFEFEIDKLIKEKELIEKTKKDIENNLISLNSKFEALKKAIKTTSVDECMGLYERFNLDKEKLESEINNIKKDYQDKTLQNEKYSSNIELLKKQLNSLNNIEISDYENLLNEANLLKVDLNSYTDEKEKLISLNGSNLSIYSKVNELFLKFKTAEKKYLQLKRLSECANGNLKGKTKLAFEQYIQTYYLDMVLFEANKRLKIMSQNRFQLLRKKDVDSMQSKTGLELEVMDFYTYKTRSTKTLSGGESFKAALALALGLSDCISNLSGAVNINSMFIDEGFGTLDSESLELALDVISNLSSTNRLIGIISHVDVLKTKIHNQIQVEKSVNGSNVKIIF